MDIRQNARLTPHGRAVLVRRGLKGQAPKAGSAAFGIDVKTVNKACQRFPAEGAAGFSIAPRDPIGCARRRWMSRSM
jgi:leucine-zipper of insertion element IS481